MKRIITIVLFGIFIISIAVFAAYGKQIRDYYSPHVDATTVNERIFSNGMFYMVLLSSCLHEDEDGNVYAYILEENSDSGEKAYYVKKVEVLAAEVEGKYTALMRIPEYDALYVSSYDKELKEGDRVVIERIVY